MFRKELVEAPGRFEEETCGERDVASQATMFEVLRILTITKAAGFSSPPPSCRTLGRSYFHSTSPKAARTFLINFLEYGVN